MSALPGRPSLDQLRRPVRKPGPLTVAIEGSELPGITCQPEPGGTVHRNIHVALFTRTKERPTLVMPGGPWRGDSR